jgi:secretion/DNA translocation related CpaE-like protein
MHRSEGDVMAGAPRPLLLTADTELLDDLLGASIAAGVAVDVAAEPSACRPQWSEAPLVVVGVDAVPAVLAARLVRRTGVLLAARGSPDAGLLEVAQRLGAEQAVGLPHGETTLLDRLADAMEPTARGQVIGVVSGRGGSGGSILAAALALTAAATGPAWLVDLDPLGGGADAGMGAELTVGSRWPDLDRVAGRLSTAALRGALPDVSGVAVLSTDRRSIGGPEPDAVRAVLAAACRGGGTVVVDLPRHRSTARDEAAVLLDDLLVVVPAEVRAVLSAGQVLAGLEPPRPEPRVVVRTVPGGLTPVDVARAVGLPLAGVLEDDPAIRVAAAVGAASDLVQVAPLAQLCAGLLAGPTAARAAA